jgi:UDP-glucose 4-epimerase
MTSILITGSEQPFAGRVAYLLRDHAGVCLREIGQPSAPDLAAALRAAPVDVVLHLGMRGEEQPAPADEPRRSDNLADARAVLDACVEHGVRRVVLRSSVLVYGARKRNPVFISEQQGILRAQQAGLTRDYAEIEALAANYTSAHPALDVVLLRCAGLVGGGIGSPLARYLVQRRPPTLAGFDPRIQVIHPDDAAAAWVLAALGSVRGPLNIAAGPPLTLMHALRLAGNTPVPIVGPLHDMAIRFGVGRPLTSEEWPFGERFLRYACVGDTRRARRALGWQPSISSYAALHELAAQRAMPRTRSTRPAPLPRT